MENGLQHVHVNLPYHYVLSEIIFVSELSIYVSACGT